MYKLIVLAVLFTVTAARPGYLPSSPVVYSAPTYIEEPTYASIGSIVKTIPTAVSHQSISQVHSAAHYVQPLVAPVLKTTYVAPVVKTISNPHLHTSYSASPVYKTYAHDTPFLHSYHPGTFLKSYAPTYAASYSSW